jgi:methylmalonyl-CoA mutase cobalamin-binding domain/chain
VVLGTPAGDTHDLGAKMVAMALTAAGFKVDYLGHDVALTHFVHKVQETDADILAISSYQTSGFKKIEEILELLETAKLNDKVKVILGGSVITEKFANQLNVGYGRGAADAVKLAKSYVGG